MTRKDFKILAEVCAKLPENEQKYKYIDQMARKLKKENPRFDRAKFLKACGINEKAQ